MKRLILGLFVLSAVAIAGCGALKESSKARATVSASPVIDRIMRRQQLHVGMSGDQAPLNMTTKDGELIGLEVDLARRVVRVDNAEIRLSPKQYRLLQVLVSNAGKVVTHRQLLNDVWGAVHRDDIQYLRVFVRKLRSRIEADPARPRYLLTELGVGYRLRTPDQLTGAA